MEQQVVQTAKESRPSIVTKACCVCGNTVTTTNELEEVVCAKCWDKEFRHRT